MMKKECAFSYYNPIAVIIYFIAVIFFGMFFAHPLYLCMSFVFSLIFYFTVKGFEGIKFLLMLLPVVILISIVNPLLNPFGHTVLFTYFGSRPFTLEALMYAVSTAFMLLSVFLWFACLNEIMTSDKYTYIFGRALPSVSMIFTMVLRLVPNYKNRINKIISARRCIGKFPSVNAKGSKKETFKNSSAVLSSLVSWAFEDAVITADSMKSRGYSQGKRTVFAVYKLDRQSVALLALIFILSAAVLINASFGGVSASFMPDMSFAETDSILKLAGAAAYAALLFIPSAVNIKEIIIWHCLKSKV